MCEPITLGIISAGLAIGGSVAAYQGQQQQVAFANAQAEQGYQFQMMQTSAQRNFEQMRYDQQESLMQQNRMLADKAYSDEIAGLNLRMMQEQEAAARQKQDAAKAAMQARGEVVASGRLGNSIDNLIADYYRQQAQYDFATERNLAYTGLQLQEEKRGAAATRGSRLASQQPYIKQPTLDPLKPIMQAKPSALPFILQGASGAISGFSSGYSTGSDFKDALKNKPPSAPKPPPKPG